MKFDRAISSTNEGVEMPYGWHSSAVEKWGLLDSTASVLLEKTNSINRSNAAPTATRHHQGRDNGCISRGDGTSVAAFQTAVGFSAAGCCIPTAPYVEKGW